MREYIIVVNNAYSGTLYASSADMAVMVARALWGIPEKDSVRAVEVEEG